MKTYEVVTGRSGKWWWIEIPEVDNGFSQARLYRQVEAMAREVIALLLEVPENSFNIKVTVKGDEAEIIQAVEASDAAANLARMLAHAEKKKAVRVLTAKGVPVRDVAELLHVSPAQVSELNKEKVA